MIVKILILFSCVILCLTKDKLAFVFEINRHGARAGILDDSPGYFPVGKGMLTPSGMRQRYLLGQWNRESEQLIPSQIYTQSTNLYRTIQSAYSEVLGMYPPNFNEDLIPMKQQRNFYRGKGMPPIKVRESDTANTALAGHALPFGFTQIPVFSYNDFTLFDDTNYSDCPYSQNMSDYYVFKDVVYEDIKPDFEPIFKPFSQMFDIGNVTFKEFPFAYLAAYCDQVVAEIFQGNPPRYNFTDFEWYLVRNSQKYLVTKSYQVQQLAQQLEVSKQLRKPLKMMGDKIQKILKGKENKYTQKYMMYSTHDTHIGNMLEILNPVNFTFFNIPYASQIYFELHYDDQCIKNTNDQSCFFVQVIHNNEELKFNNCEESKHCSYDNFIKYMRKILITDSINQLCEVPYTATIISQQ